MKTTHEERENWRKAESGSTWGDLTSVQLTNRILGVLIVIAISMAVFQIVRNRMTFDEAFNSLSTELFGAAVTFYALELVIRPKKQREDIEVRKQQLIYDMKSGVNDVAVKAVEELRKEGWLQDELLRGIDLKKASLQGADLTGIDLQGANLWLANLEWANLEDANLMHANLEMTNLQHAKLMGTNLQEADLYGANLRNASLFWANLQSANLGDGNLQGAVVIEVKLQGAYLSGADLNGASFREVNFLAANLEYADGFATATFDNKTILPNRDLWQEGYNFERFADPEHEDFWKMDWSNVPEALYPPWYKAEQDLEKRLNL